MCEILVLVANQLPSSTIARSIMPSLSPTAHEPRLSSLFIAGWVMTALGGGLRFLCYHQLGRQFTYSLTIVEDHNLITTGPYAIVRHPSYIAWITFISGVLVTQLCPGSWFAECGPSGSFFGCAAMAVWVVYNLYIVAMLPARMRREDEALKKQFGDKWVQWSRHTPYKLVPGIY
ncbi:uncharacterized protein TRAVEDRAFT_19788 [Trametes versicolor FP-101664 SS1]|uniref:uncharacterized protein n=1 Tax=Trametes versicolor (strain FP-101664) TaxID=717944 RepID=UPI0004622479|nr:uncharacterized protein TRAVEDRAFT_19788 [Trametes versicolor FP-101664 SS1]EIW59334.1 hypothetical protein TRAVEDRAFT_19788 [Trametes versicolor FP-101664 SS1]